MMEQGEEARRNLLSRVPESNSVPQHLSSGKLWGENHFRLLMIKAQGLRNVSKLFVFSIPNRDFEIKFTVICLNCSQLMSPGKVKEACVEELPERLDRGVRVEGHVWAAQSEGPGKCPKGPHSLQVANGTLQKYSM